MSQEKLSYNEAIAEIEEILKKMENEELDVDMLSGQVQRVSFLIRYCRKKLLQTQEEVAKVLEEIEDKEKLS